MSDFLLNLARRSAGLAPVVRARSVSPAPIPGGSPADLEVVDGELASETPQRPAAVVTSPVASRDPVATQPSEAKPAPIVAISAPAAAPIVQRVSLVAPVAPAAPAPGTPPAEVLEAAESLLAPAAPREGAALEPTGADRAATMVESTPPAAQPAPPPRVGEAAPELRVATIVPARLGESDQPTTIAPEVERGPEIVLAEQPIIERGIEPAAAAALEPAVVLVEPAPASDAGRAAMAWSEPAADRTVHVRIGAIEIHSTEPPSSPLAPAAPAQPASQGSPATGFDEFARLRSYAPWEW